MPPPPLDVVFALSVFRVDCDCHSCASSSRSRSAERRTRERGCEEASHADVEGNTARGGGGVSELAAANWAQRDARQRCARRSGGARRQRTRRATGATSAEHAPRNNGAQGVIRTFATLGL